MDITLSLSHAKATDPAIVGVRAAALAEVHLARYPTTQAVIIPCTFFDEFLTASGIAARIGQIYAQHAQTLDGYTLAFKELSELFHSIRFTTFVRETLQDAYESLASPADAQGLLDAAQPLVTFIPSPTYPTNQLDLREHVQGFEGFLHALKDAWLSLFLPEHVLERQHFGITNFSTGLIIAPDLPGEGIGEGYYNKTSEPPITVKTYLGALDTQASVTADTYRIAADHLHITERIIRTQPYRLKWTGTTIIEQALGDVGAKQKLNDRQVLEIARLTKRAHVTLEQDLVCYARVHGEEIIILFINPIEHQQLTQTITESPEPKPQPKDEFIELDEMTQQPLPEASVSEPQPAENQPVDIYTDEPAITPPEDEPVMTMEDDDYPLMEAADEPAADEAAADMTTDEELTTSIPEQAPLAPAMQEEETLFDLVQQDDDVQTPSETATEQAPAMQETPATPQDLIAMAMGLVEAKMLAAYQEAFNQDPESYEEMKSRLGREGKLILSERDLHRIEQAHASAQAGEEIRDKATGLAWRLLQELR